MPAIVDCSKNYAGFMTSPTCTSNGKVITLKINDPNPIPSTTTLSF